MNVLALVVSQLVALALGGALVAWLIPRGPGAVAAIASYGYVLGSIAITFVLRLLSAAGIAWTFWLPCTVAAMAAIVIAAIGRRRWAAISSKTAVPAAEGPWLRALFWMLWALIAAHVGLALIESWLRPLFPWDAAAQWATKAHVWFANRRIVPFVDDMTWIGATGDIFTDAHPSYPGTVPLFQVWAALAWGSFDDAKMNIGWPLFLAALAFGTYGQLRQLGFAGIQSAAVAYLIASLPFVDVHAALAGYADLAIAVLYAFAWLGFATWAREPNWRNALLTIACALSLPLLKMPGLIWATTLVPGVVAHYVSRRLLARLVVAALAALFACLVYVSYVHPIVFLGYQIAPQRISISNALIGNLLLFANWHLLAFLLPIVLIAARRALFSSSMLPLTAVTGAAATALVVVFFFTSASVEGIGAYTTINRALLHVVPALIVYAACVAREAWCTRRVDERFEAAPA